MRPKPHGSVIASSQDLVPGRADCKPPQLAGAVTAHEELRFLGTHLENLVFFGANQKLCANVCKDRRCVLPYPSKQTSPSWRKSLRSHPRVSTRLCCRRPRAWSRCDPPHTSQSPCLCEPCLPFCPKIPFLGLSLLPFTRGALALCVCCTNLMCLTPVVTIVLSYGDHAMERIFSLSPLYVARRASSS